MPDLVPVDHDPFQSAPPPVDPTTTQLVPVDHNPFADHLEALGQIKDYLTPGWAKPFAGMTPEQEQHESAVLTDPNAPAGKIGPGYLSDQDRAMMAAGDVASTLAPELKGVSLAMAGVFPRGFWKAGGEGFEQLMKLNEQGLSQKEIAAHFGIKQSSVSDAMANAGITPAKPVGAAPTWSQETIDHLTAGIKAGKSFGDIADELGMTRSKVAGKANRLGLVGQSAPSSAPSSTAIKTPGLPDVSPEELAQYEKIFVPVDHDPFKAQ